MKYIQTNKAARSPSYRGSVPAVHKDSDADLQAIYSDIRKHNAEVRKTSRKYGRLIGRLRRVSLMGRGPRAEAARAEGRNPRAFDSYLPADLAVSFDIYVQECTGSNYVLKRELETGLTAAEQKQLDNLEMQVRMLQYTGRTRNGS